VEQVPDSNRGLPVAGVVAEEDLGFIHSR
jgi:hypothetical protein